MVRETRDYESSGFRVIPDCLGVLKSANGYIKTQMSEKVGVFGKVLQQIMGYVAVINPTGNFFARWLVT